MRLPKLLAVGLAAALTIGVNNGPAQATPADGAISVKIELGGLDPENDRPRVFQRTNIVPGPGAEVDKDDEVQNPELYCGDLSVDVDPATRRVTVGNSDEVCDFALVRVTIESDYIRNLQASSDSLFGADTSNFTRTITPTATGVVVTWIDPSDNWYKTTGSAVFTWEPISFGAATPKIGGKKVVGKKLKVKGISAASLTPQAATLTYQWYRGKKMIKKATKATYKVKRADVGKKVRVKVTASAYGIAPTTYTSKKVKIKAGR
ncbi:hypothetical protein ACJ5H2_06140 [Nocardioides sp. R1-1]|uniref:hypothetical protein n=1 Tax=Nocardioides sp. R1-1 TaxID=3383502 RepID=UPI0038D0FD3C